MPELPDVESYRRGLAPALHRRIAGVDVRASRMLEDTDADVLHDALEGGAFEATQRHGKYLFARIDDGPWLVLHFGMTGRLDHLAPDAPEPPHTRLRLELEDGTRIVGVWKRRLGRTDLTRDPAAFARAHDLGPDALALDAEGLGVALQDRRGGIKAALMDQSVVAGIGNVYSDEILFHGGIRPDAVAADVGAARLDALSEAGRRVLETAVERLASDRPLPDDLLLPHRRPAGSCPRCGGGLATWQLSERTCWLCPACQH